jgi:hypothetical protein
MVIFAVLKGDWLGVVDFEIRMLTAAATSSTSPTNSARLRPGLTREAGCAWWWWAGPGSASRL